MIRKDIIILTGPSGTGKTAISNLLKEENGAIEFVSTTTREIRDNEKDGVNYNFTTRENFEQMISNNQLVEYAEYSGNLYGLTGEEINKALLSEDNLFVAVLEINGVRKLQELYKDSKNIRLHTFFINSSISSLMHRMKDRGDSFDKIAERIQNLVDTKELDNKKYCQYVVNNDRELESVKEEILNIIYKN